jgi:DNA polymerase-3 subunit delta'
LPVLALKPQFEGFRVVMIVSAEWLNTAAANAFLKCLEEPNERTVIILVSANVGRLPATILSRCQHLKMTPPPATQALAWLRAQQAPGDHALLLTLAQGAPLLALQYAEENSIALRQSCFDDWMGIAQAQRSPLTVAERWQKLPVVPLLNWLSSWVVDLIKSHYAVQSAYLHNPDLQPVLQEAQKRLDLTALFSLYDVLLTTRKQIHTPLNRQLLFEVILIHWFNLNCRE